MRNSNILLVFDCFGVVVNGVSGEWLEGLSNKEEIRCDIYKIFDLADRGIISLDEAINRCASLAHEDPKDTLCYWKDNVKALELVNHLKELKEKYTVIMLTNATVEHIDEVVNRFNLEPLFDDIIVSAKEKMAKPDLEFFNLAINRFNNKYDKIFFMDDNPRNVKASYDAGMIGILYKDYQSFTEEISKYIDL